MNSSNNVLKVNGSWWPERRGEPPYNLPLTMLEFGYLLNGMECIIDVRWGFSTILTNLNGDFCILPFILWGINITKYTYIFVNYNEEVYIYFRN